MRIHNHLARTHAHPEPGAGRRESTFGSLNCGYGSRHRSDTAPFTLWDVASEDFRHPAPHEHQWIQDAFSAVCVTYTWPQIFIETPAPPSPVPLTVACVAAVFLLVGSRPRYLSTRTDYSNPRMADPIPEHLHLPKWEKPSNYQCQVVLESLEQIMNIEAVNFMPPTIIVELRHHDGKEYSKRSLPGIVGGRTTLYHHSHTPFWGTVVQARERLIDPSDAIQDTTNYLQSDLGTLCPGVRVEGSLTSRQGWYLNATMGSSAGVLLCSIHEGPRLTVPNHDFLNTADVYHPSSQTAGICIGQITKRFEHLDVALVQPLPSSTFTNADNFQVQEPKPLLQSNEVPNNVWCGLDGMATGLVFLRVAGMRLRATQRPLSAVIPFTDFMTENIMEYIGPAGGRVQEEIYGAPIVVDGDHDGGVVGFSRLRE